MRMESLCLSLPRHRFQSRSGHVARRCGLSTRTGLGFAAMIALTLVRADIFKASIVFAQPSVTKTYKATPKQTKRYWMTAVAPNPRGGWNFIAQYNNFPVSQAGEYVIVDLATGLLQSVATPASMFTSSNYSYYLSGDTTCQQYLVRENRAANGRIFWGEAQDFCTIGYYNPTTETIGRLPQYASPPTGTVDTVYRFAQSPVSSGKLYAGTIVTGLSRTPQVIEIDPTTNPPTQRVVGSVGIAAESYEKYAYYLAADPWATAGAAQGWIYVAYGKSPWRLYAMNIATGATVVLAQDDASGVITDISFNMNQSTVQQGITATIMRGGVPSKMWCLDGVGYPTSYLTPVFPPGQQTRDCTPAAYPFVNPPEIDVNSLWPSSTGAAAVSYKLFGQSSFTNRNFSLASGVSPINIESLLTLPDGRLFGNGIQYSGYFTYAPLTSAVTGTPGSGPSTGPRVYLNNRVYLSGYPNGALYSYDPAGAWNPSSTLGAGNPAVLGYWHFNNVVKRTRAVADGGNGRLYSFGDQEREAFNVGIGYYDMGTGAFAGHANSPLNTLTGARSLAVVTVGGNKRVVASTFTSANLFVFDANLTHLASYNPGVGAGSGGELFTGPGGDIVAITSGAIYRYNVSTGQLVSQTPFQISGQNVDCYATTKKSDGTIWGIAVKPDTTGYLVRIDPSTLQFTNLGAIPGYYYTTASTGEKGNLAWSTDAAGEALFYSFGTDLYKLTFGIPPTVSITSPSNNASFSMGSNITVNANAADSDGTISKVEFFHGAAKIGEDTSSPYNNIWYFVDTGTYALTAKATDNSGLSTTSSPINITVGASPKTRLIAEAEAGTLVSPMQILSDDWAYSYQCVSSNIGESGSTTLTFNATVAGNYAIWCRVIAPNAGASSFYVSVDGGAEDICDVLSPSSSWQYVRVNGRGGTSTPNTIPVRVFNWGTGTHTVQIRTRDANVKFDKIVLTTDPEEVPI